MRSMPETTATAQGAQRYVASHEAMYIDGIPHMERADVGIIIRLQGCIRAFQHTESNAFLVLHTEMAVTEEELYMRAAADILCIQLENRHLPCLMASVRGRATDGAGRRRH